MGALVGRDRELGDLAGRVRSHRLVTVVGPGGVGKTALARAVAARVGDGFPLGVRHVDLTRIDDEDVVPGELAAQLGFDSFDALLSSPNDRPLLLVVDNCEHLLDETAQAVVQILGACQQPTVLATSRSPLELPGESVLSLAPLAVPGGTDDPRTCPSVQLFLERCRDAGASVGPDDLGAVVELCRRLDGLPLAIEIAAARARTLSVAEIVTRLDASVDVLERPRFRGDPRHRSVADTIKWSYDLLSPGAAELLDHLGVFAGPFGATAARAVSAIEDRARFDALMEELAWASLVVVDTVGSETRYRLLDTVRHVALDRLRRRDALAPAYDRFVDHVVASVLQLVAGSTTTWRPGLLHDLVDAFDDLAEAVRWCNAHDANPKRAFRLCSILWAVVHQGRADDIADLIRRTAARWPDRGSTTAAQTMAALATAEYVTGHPERALELVEATLPSLAAAGLPSVTLRRVEGQARRALGDTTGALAAFRAGAAAGHELAMPSMAMELETAAAQVLADQGDVEGALTAMADVVRRGAEAGSTIIESWARTTYGWVLLRADPAAALRVIDAALEQARRIDYPIAVAVNLRSRAFGQLLLGDLAGATASASELLDDLLARGALSNARLLVDVTAVIAHRRGHPAWESLVAAARTLPITTLTSAQYELVPLPPTIVPPIPRHEVFGAVRNVLADLRSAVTAGSAAAEDAAEKPAPGARIALRGDTYEIAFGGRTVALRTSKGLDDLVRLIEAGGAEMHCLDLAGAAVEESSTGEVIDERARREYERRIRELQEEIEEAEGNNDYARAYRYQVELDALIEQLTAALGRGNRTRTNAGTAERARSAVTHRVRAAIRNLDKLHPSLARHLTHSIQTGTYCSYRPEQPVGWRVVRP